MTEKRNDKLTKIIAEIAGKDQRVTAEMVLDYAENKDHPLHEGWGFIWEEKVAARKFNLSVAQSLIASVKINIRTERLVISSVAYVRDPSLGPKEQGSIAVSLLSQSKADAMEAMEAEAERIASCLKRADGLALSTGLLIEFDEMLESVCGLKRIKPEPVRRATGRQGQRRQ